MRFRIPPCDISIKLHFPDLCVVFRKREVRDGREQLELGHHGCSGRVCGPHDPVGSLSVTSRRLIPIFAGAMLLAGPASALDQPTVWRDPDTGCGYFLTPQGGVSPRYQRNGLPDCPDANSGERLVDDATRGFSQGLQSLQREVERLRDRFSRPEQQGDPL